MSNRPTSSAQVKQLVNDYAIKYRIKTKEILVSLWFFVFLQNLVSKLGEVVPDKNQPVPKGHRQPTVVSVYELADDEIPHHVVLFTSSGETLVGQIFAE